MKFLKNKKGFTLIELIVVMAIIGILVLLAAPKFLGYTKDADIAAMRADAKVLSNAALLYNIENDGAWPQEFTDVNTNGKFDLGDTLVAALDYATVDADLKTYLTANGFDNTKDTLVKLSDKRLAEYVKNIKGSYTDYALVLGGKMEGEVVHLKGLPSRTGTLKEFGLVENK